MLSPVRNIAEVEKGLRERFSQLQKELEGPESEAASAREAFRSLVDRAVIAPMGDPKSRTGSLSIRVEGKITALLGFSASDQVHAILSCTSPRAGQYRVKDQWSVSTVLESMPVRHSDETRRRRLEQGALKYDGFLLEELRRATAPLTAAALARAYLTSQNIAVTRARVGKWSHTFRERLNPLKELGLTDIVRLPSRSYQGWVLAERKSELSGATPVLLSNHGDNEVIFAELNHASRPLTVNDLARAIIRLSGERSSETRLTAIRCRVRTCLKHHRETGVIVPLNMPGNSGYGWALAEREQELRPPPTVSVERGPFDDQIRAIMDSANERLTSEEIATEILRQLPPPRKKRAPTLRSVRNRVWTFLRNRRRHGHVRPVVVKGKKAQGWEWIADSGSPSGPAPTSSNERQIDQRAGV